MEGYLKATVEKRMIKREVQSRQALYVAEGGVEWAKAHLIINPELRKGEIGLATGYASITIDNSGEEYNVISEGHSGLAVRKIAETLRLETGKWNIKSYQELHR
jgi:hypothetical protein